MFLMIFQMKWTQTCCWYYPLGTVSHIFDGMGENESDYISRLIWCVLFFFSFLRLHIPVWPIMQSDPQRFIDDNIMFLWSLIMKADRDRQEWLRDETTGFTVPRCSRCTQADRQMKRQTVLLINSRFVTVDLKVTKIFFALPKDFSFSVGPCECD